ncbi:MAG: hypothetical protein IPJ30_15265 [Acidobacteria bacterium]|nr:hypothetical protein [Acidobacteriota bacterium]
MRRNRKPKGETEQKTPTPAASVASSVQTTPAANTNSAANVKKVDADDQKKAAKTANKTRKDA